MSALKRFTQKGTHIILFYIKMLSISVEHINNRTPKIKDQIRHKKDLLLDICIFVLHE